jgi:hypothetical protein
LALGSADVVVLGSSRTAQAIDCPQLARETSEGIGRPVNASSYALGGAQIAENLPMARHVLRHRPKPRLILYGVAPEQIGPHDIRLDAATGRWVQEPTPVNERSAMFWLFSDYLEARRTFGSRIDPYLPIVFRNEVEKHYHTMRARGRLMNAIRNVLRGREGSPILGESLDEEGRTRSMAAGGYDEQSIREHVEEAHLLEGSYPFSDQRIALFRQLIQMCSEADVGIAFFELPNAEVFERYFPPGTRERFREAFRELSAGTGARLYSLEELGLDFDYDEYRDAVHLNMKGTSRYTAAIAKKITIPLLRQGQTSQR